MSCLGTSPLWVLSTLPILALASCAPTSEELVQCTDIGDVYLYSDKEGLNYQFNVVSESEIIVEYDPSTVNPYFSSPHRIDYNAGEEAFTLSGYFDLAWGRGFRLGDSIRSGRCFEVDSPPDTAELVFRCEREGVADFGIRYDPEIGVTAFWLYGQTEDQVATLKSPHGLARFCPRSGDESAEKTSEKRQ